MASRAVAVGHDQLPCFADNLRDRIDYAEHLDREVLAFIAR